MSFRIKHSFNFYMFINYIVIGGVRLYLNRNYNNHYTFFFLYRIFRDPIDALLLEQHMNTPFRSYNDASLSQLVAQDAMAFVERAKQHLQMFGGSPYPDAILPQMYGRPNMAGLNLGLWQGFWPQQLPPGFLSGMSMPKSSPPHHQSQQQQQQSSQPPAHHPPPPPQHSPHHSLASPHSLPPPQSSPPAPTSSQTQSQQQATPQPPPPLQQSPPSHQQHHQAASELREKYFKRFSPYQIPQQYSAPSSPPN